MGPLLIHVAASEEPADDNGKTASRSDQPNTLMQRNDRRCLRQSRMVGVLLARDQTVATPSDLAFAYFQRFRVSEPMSQFISSLMQPTVSSVGMDDTVAQVEALLASKHLTWVPVIEPSRGEAVGVISASDIVSFHAQERDATTTHAWQMCSYKPIVVDIETPIAMVAALMVERGVHHVVVTGRNGVAGVVSSLDFVRTFLPEPSRSKKSRP